MKIDGPVDADVALLVCEQLAALAEGDAPLELDLREATFAGEPALRMIVEEVRGLLGRRADVRVRSVDPKVRAPFVQAGLSRLLEP